MDILVFLIVTTIVYVGIYFLEHYCTSRSKEESPLTAYIEMTNGDSVEFELKETLSDGILLKSVFDMRAILKDVKEIKLKRNGKEIIKIMDGFTSYNP
jgi:hypothetical protein